MAKTAKKTTSRKTATKSKSASAKSNNKSASAAVANKRGADRTVTLEKLYKFNLFAAAANLLFAILSVVFISPKTVDATWAYATQDLIAGSLGPAYKIVATVEVRYLLAVIFGLSAIFSLLLATRLRKSYDAGVKNSTSGLRWLFSGITLALTLELATVLAGIGDILTLKLVGGLIFATTILAFLVERENKGTKKQYVTFALSVFTGVIAWLPLAGSLLGTTLYGVTNFDWYVYVLALAVLVGFISIGWSQYKHVKKGVSARGYLQFEGKYASTDFLIKLAVFVILVSALHK